MVSRRFERALSMTGLLLALGGCSGQGAPSFILFGAYFPGWMFCGLVAILGAIAIRVLIVTLGFANSLPVPLFVCVSGGLIFATAVWLIWFGR